LEVIVECNQQPVKRSGVLCGRLYKDEIVEVRTQSPDKMQFAALQILMATHRRGDKYEAVADGYPRDMGSRQSDRRTDCKRSATKDLGE